MKVSELVKILQEMDPDIQLNVKINDNTVTFGAGEKEESLLDAAYTDEPTIQDWLEILIRDYDAGEISDVSERDDYTCETTGSKVSYIPKDELDEFFREYNLGERCDLDVLNGYLKEMNYVARTCLETNIHPWEVEISRL
ncbi:MAG: hypothetical protein JXA66_03205 [Oligoflexia bacterium]|nr:hypothetical protein [Oligoflexia bacterium]